MTYSNCKSNAFFRFFSKKRLVGSYFAMASRNLGTTAWSFRQLGEISFGNLADAGDCEKRVFQPRIRENPVKLIKP